MSFITRRSLLVGLIFAPAIVCIQSIMPVQSLDRFALTRIASKFTSMISPDGQEYILEHDGLFHRRSHFTHFYSPDKVSVIDVKVMDELSIDGARQFEVRAG